ncbi:DUF5110 domain-containing protein, partial [Lactobacillus sp. XV13L]|nr:DUF5110 domain-containing protein [Lactobacillus sp. XV13L]
MIPVAPATNTPAEYQRLNQQRRFEIYPGKTSAFTLYEDDGISAQYQAGRYAQTQITSALQGAELSINVAPTTGTYDGMNTQKTTEFDIRMKKVPTTIKCMIGSRAVVLQQASDRNAFQQASNAYFLDQNYHTNPYLQDGGDELKQTFLRIKLAPIDVSQNAVALTLTGVDQAARPVNELPLVNQTVLPPTGLKQDQARTTPTSIVLFWQPVSG